MSILVYHGSVDIVKSPKYDYGRENLDFGRGFYVTDNEQQAENWALSQQQRFNKTPIINVYQLQQDEILSTMKCRIFRDYDLEWMEFIIANRNGIVQAEKYDYIEGGVANDRIINSIKLYMQGYLSQEATLRNLSMHRPNNQICLSTQTTIDKYLHYEYSRELQ